MCLFGWRQHVQRARECSVAFSFSSQLQLFGVCFRSSSSSLLLSRHFDTMLMYTKCYFNVCSHVYAHLSGRVPYSFLTDLLWYRCVLFGMLSLAKLAGMWNRSHELFGYNDVDNLRKMPYADKQDACEHRTMLFQRRWRGRESEREREIGWKRKRFFGFVHVFDTLAILRLRSERFAFGVCCSFFSALRPNHKLLKNVGECVIASLLHRLLHF